MKKHRLLLLFTFCFSLSAGHLAAQEPIDVRLSAITLSSKIRDLNYYNGNSVGKLTIPVGLRATRFRYQGSPTVKFFREGDTVIDETGKSVPRTIGSVKIPRATGDWLLIFQRAPGREEKYAVAAIPDDQVTFRPGMYRIINAAPFDIALMINKEKRLVRAKGFADIKAESNTEYQPVIMYSMVGEDPVASFKGSFFYSKDKRFIYVISENEHGRDGRINLTTIPESIRSAPAAE